MCDSLKIVKPTHLVFWRVYPSRKDHLGDPRSTNNMISIQRQFEIFFHSFRLTKVFNGLIDCKLNHPNCTSSCSTD